MVGALHTVIWPHLKWITWLMFVDFATHHKFSRCYSSFVPPPTHPLLVPSSTTNGYTIAPRISEKGLTTRTSGEGRDTGRGWQGGEGQALVAMPQVCLLYILSILYTDIYLHLVRLRTRLLTKWHAPHLRTPWRVVRSPTWYPTTRRKVCMTTTHRKRGSRRVSSSGMYFCSLFLLTKLPHHHQQLTSPQHVQRRRQGPKTR